MSVINQDNKQASKKGLLKKVKSNKSSVTTKANKLINSTEPLIVFIFRIDFLLTPERVDRTWWFSGIIFDLDYVVVNEGISESDLYSAMREKFEQKYPILFEESLVLYGEKAIKSLRVVMKVQSIDRAIDYIKTVQYSLKKAVSIQKDLGNRNVKIPEYIGFYAPPPEPTAEQKLKKIEAALKRQENLRFREAQEQAKLKAMTSAERGVYEAEALRKELAKEAKQEAGRKKAEATRIRRQRYAKFFSKKMEVQFIKTEKQRSEESEESISRRSKLIDTDS